MDILRKKHSRNKHKGGDNSDDELMDNEEHRYQSVHTPVPVRSRRSPENGSGDVENSIRRLLLASLTTPRLWRHKSLDPALLDSSRMGKIPRELFVSSDHVTQWQAATEHASMAVVTVRVCQAAPFDTAGAIATEATGFVVDKERGIILTNRHVACAGPFVGEAVFQNREAIDVHVIYRDPVHDFG
ncbi:hypothetical protein EV175_004940, partial [Coemansia sp. RSA 1933]